MESVNLKEARRRLGELVKVAEGGETVVITRRGREVARLVLAEPPQPKRIPDLAAFRASIEVQGKPLSEIVLDARREARY